jgi:ketosteroid isomerase-like protein
MNEQQNVEIVKRGYEAFGRGDIEGLLALFDENIDWTTPGPPEVPFSGQRRGRAAVGEFFRLLADTLDFQRFEPKEFVAQGDTVIVLGEDTSTLKSTSTVLDFEFAHVFRVRDGKIVWFKEYGDMTPFVLALRGAGRAGV